MTSPKMHPAFPPTPTGDGYREVETRFLVRADYFLGQIDLKKFRIRCPHYSVHLADPLIIEPVAGSFAVLSKFGAVTFWGCSEEVVAEIIHELKELPGTQQHDDDVADEIEVIVGAGEDKVTFSEIYLRDLSLKKIKIVSLAFCQSVALDRFEREVLAALHCFEPVVASLRRDGKLRLSERQIMRDIGFALDVRAAVLANLTLFEDPPETWESEDLARLDTELYDHFDLEERASAINQKIAFLTDLNSTLMDALNHRKSRRLEWIIIILIAIEIVFLFYVEAL